MKSVCLEIITVVRFVFCPVLYIESFFRNLHENSSGCFFENYFIKIN